MSYKNILLIDDDEDDCEIFLVAIEKAYGTGNYTAIHDATNALQQLEEKMLVPELIFLDLNMPVMNGVQFLTEIKKRETLRDIPVIILTTSSQIQLVNETKSLGAYDFITKPVSFNGYLDILQSIA